LYSYGFDRYEIEDYTGIDRGELISAAKQIRNYFNNDEEWIVIEVIKQGEYIPNLFNAREIFHMKDVKNLIRGVYFVQYASVIIIGICFILGFIGFTRNTMRTSLKRISYASLATLLMTLLIGVLSIVGFDRLFIYFHLISFNNDLWILDPRRDYLIAMFPQSFFLDATLLIGLGILILSTILTVLPIFVIKKLNL
jgi:integral membrane protein (TIGR01906 family)